MRAIQQYGPLNLRKCLTMKYLLTKLGATVRAIKNHWYKPGGRLTITGFALLAVLTVPGLYFGFATPDKPACFKAENYNRTDTIGKKIQHHGFMLAGRALQCTMLDTDLMKYMINTLPNPDDPTKQDGQETSKKIKGLWLHPDAFLRMVRVQMSNDALADVTFPAESNDRLKLRNELAPRLGVLAPTLAADEPGFNWLVWGPALLMVAGMIFVSRGQMSRILKTQKSLHKVILPDAPGPTFDDVAGAEEAKIALSEYEDFLRNPKTFMRLGGRPNGGVLLVGAPGNGKTLLASALAKKAGVPMLTISGTSFVDTFVGVGAARVRDMLAEAKKYGSCIIFVDEIDAIGRDRKGAAASSSSNEHANTLNALLVAMDGVDEKGEKILDLENLGIVWIAATNIPDVLDPALTRPGRLDRIITVPAPNLAGRLQLLKLHTRKIKLADNIDLLEIARLCPGYSGASMKNFANQAALIATRRGKEAVELVDFVDARETIEMGMENRSLALSPMQKLKTSLHEMGHTLLNLAGEVYGHDPFQKVTNIPRGNALGLTWFRPEADKVGITREELMALLATLMGGRVAEELCLGGKDKISSGAMGDMRMAEERAYAAVTQLGFAENAELEGRAWGSNDPNGLTLSERHKELIQGAVSDLTRKGTNTAREYLESHIQTLYQLTIELYNKETLDRKEVLAIVAAAEENSGSDALLTWEDVLAQTVGRDEATIAAVR